MDTHTLFIETLDELARRTSSADSEYDLVRAALLLRQLLIDGDRLADKVNRDFHLAIRYTVARSPIWDMQLADGAVFIARQDGLDPRTAIPGATTVELKLDGFIAETVMYINPHTISIGDLIDYLAHVEGGVHAGAAKTPKDRALLEATRDIQIGGSPPAARSVMAVSRVVLSALEPLRQAIESERAGS